MREGGRNQTTPKTAVSNTGTVKHRDSYHCHGLTEWFGLKKTLKIIQFPTPALPPGCSEPHQTGLELFQGWGIQNISRQPVHVSPPSQ